MVKLKTQDLTKDQAIKAIYNSLITVNKQTSDCLPKPHPYVCITWLVSMTIYMEFNQITHIHEHKTDHKSQQPGYAYYLVCEDHSLFMQLQTKA